MKHLITIFIFCIVLFLYLHINHHYKTGNDLEIYTIEQPTKDKFEEICDIRQPVILDYNINNVMQNCNLSTIDDNYGAFDIKLRNTLITDNDNEIYLPIVLKEAIRLFENDTQNKFITENNTDFLEETGLIKHFKYNDEFLRPPMVINCLYDLWSGSVNANTPLRYHLCYRNYFYVTSGKVKMKLIPPKYTKYLNIYKDHENNEYRSPINPWDVQNIYKAEFDKVKVLDLELETGSLIYIPAYWNYSICYTEMSCITIFKYRTLMNTVAILPDLIMNILQNQNITRKKIKGKSVSKTITNKNTETSKIKAQNSKSNMVKSSDENTSNVSNK